MSAKKDKFKVKKFRRYDGVTLSLPQWVYDEAPPLMVDGKTLPHMGLKPMGGGSTKAVKEVLKATEPKEDEL